MWNIGFVDFLGRFIGGKGGGVLMVCMFFRFLWGGFWELF
jgi:hypothetical protein